MSFKISSTILLKRNIALQSYYFKELIPLGDINWIIKSLLKLIPDEIHIIDLNGEIYNSLGEIKDFSNFNLPLAIGGGINNIFLNKKICCERFIINSKLFDDLFFLKKLRDLYGKQSIIGFLPFKIINNKPLFYNSSIKNFVDLDTIKFFEIIQNTCEIILLDVLAQGSHKGFDFRILKFIKGFNKNIYISGGINKHDINLAKKKGLAGVSIDNSSLYYPIKITER